MAQGSAGPDGAKGANPQLEKCQAPKGTIAVVEPQSQVLHGLRRYGLGSPTSVIRMLVQQSNCSRSSNAGAGMQSLMREGARGAAELQAARRGQGADGRRRLHRQSQRGVQREQRQAASAGACSARLAAGSARSARSPEV